MKYVVTKMIEVEAETPEEAVAKSKEEGRTLSLSAAQRPAMAQTPAPQTSTAGRPPFQSQA